jgi:hypothetical protein
VGEVTDAAIGARSLAATAWAAAGESSDAGRFALAESAGFEVDVVVRDTEDSWNVDARDLTGLDDFCGDGGDETGETGLLLFW